MLPNHQTFCVIMAGGFGSRFWPMSRADQPKQFLDILGTGRSMIQETAERFESIVPCSNFMILTGQKFENKILQQLPAIQASQVLSEPERRNTAPAIAYAAYRVYSVNPDAIMVVTPSDHYIGDLDSFRHTLNRAIDFVSKHDVLLTIGIQPTYPATSYGYIEMSPELAANGGIGPIARFKEKPDLEEAKELLASGKFLWNSGMFVWKAKDIVAALEEYLPEVALPFAEIDRFYSAGETEKVSRAFLASPSISIDYGVMEKARNVYTMIGDFEWDDVGTWPSLQRHEKRNRGNNNTTLEEGIEPREKDLFLEESENTLVRTTNPEKKIIVIGLQDYLVVDTEDVLFIAPKKEEEKLHKQLDHFAEKTNKK